MSEESSQINLSYTNLDDGFIVQLMWIVKNCYFSVKALILDQTRRTTNDANSVNDKEMLEAAQNAQDAQDGYACDC